MCLGEGKLRIGIELDRFDSDADLAGDSLVTQSLDELGHVRELLPIVHIDDTLLCTLNMI